MSVADQPTTTASKPVIDIAANRASRKWSRRELIGRACWELLSIPFFAWTPRPFWGWRRIVLRSFGARVGRDVHVHPTVRIAVPWNLDIGDAVAVGDRVILYNLGRISIGPSATISHGAHLCAGTHDYRRADFPLLKQPISIGEAAWICSDAFVGPDVDIGAFAIVGARAVVVRDVCEWSIVAGNPAREIGKRSVSALVDEVKQSASLRPG